jgi:hypothetical protein
MAEKANNARFGSLMLGNKLHKSHALIQHFLSFLIPIFSVNPHAIILRW